MSDAPERRDRQPKIKIAEYLQQVRSLAERFAIQEREEVELAAARGRVLAQAITAGVDIPGFANSAMDGYAVRAADLEEVPARLRIVGEQPAGPARDVAVGAGEAVRIMTGAPLPAGADTVVQSELTEEDDGQVVIGEAVRPGANVRHPGEDVSSGETVLVQGTRLAGRQLSAAAAVGTSRVQVVRQPVLGVLSTGDELVPPGGVLAPGQIYESNSYLLAGLAEESGARVIRRHAVADRPEELAVVLDELTSQCDAVLLSGGVSVGRFDVVRNLLDGEAESTFHRVSLQPGKPQGYAVWKGTPLLAFPGNPVGAFISFHVFGRPFIRTLTGQVNPQTPRRQIRAGASWKSPQGRSQYVPGRVRLNAAGQVVFEPTSAHGSGSHLVATLAQASALCVIPADVEFVQAGQLVDVEDIL
ncbi:gephyrin-like molybdotransferase Glp [Scrofimicrobium sp. R131]|uniref:Molybdopterin molybdenumtransferase n=1 Tax=Scrofimicrobium appendicitidis TaxID=3079930 RepID=A0AAU7V5E4_9ACTO